MCSVKSVSKFLVDTALIAPCGMNCGICMAFLRDKNKCPGCREDSSNKAKYCIVCKIKNCAFLQEGKAYYCFACEKYCTRLKQLDKRYRTKYNMSMIENLENIKKSGINQFTENEKVRWTCPECGGTICVHRGYCYSCGYIKST